MPAVSLQMHGDALKHSLPETRSRVVPGRSVTIAFSSPTKAFKREDFAPVGLPQITTCRPSSRIRLLFHHRQPQPLCQGQKARARSPTASSWSISSG